MIQIRKIGNPSFILPGFIVFLAMALTSCEARIDTIPKTDILSLPTLTARNFESVFDDSGRVQLKLFAPLMQSYQNNEFPYSEFTRGIKVIFFDGNKDSVGYVVARYAKFTDKKKLWELRDSVVIVNGSNDRLETEQVFWEQDKDLIYSDRFVKIINEDQTIMGTGFESDIRLTKRRIKNPSGPIYLKDE